MKVVIPMSGMGQRFVDAGYFMPKPLIGVGGKMIIEYIVDMFDKENDDFVFIVNNLHIVEFGIDKVINELVPSATVVAIDPHKYGPVYAVQAAYQHIGDDDEVIVAYCDNPHVWDYDDFKNHVRKNNLDGCILTHTGFHPHRLNSTRMAYLKVDDQNRLLEIKEKASYTNDHWTEHGSTGTYYFKTGKIVKHYFDECVRRNITHNGEYYVTLVYNMLVEDNLNVSFYDTEFAMVFGTPAEVRNFEAWNTIVNSSQVKCQEDAKNCYKYWSKYYGK